MKKILELITVINRNKTKSISIIGNGSTTKIDKFYRLLTEQEDITDDEAFAVLYHDEKSRNSYHKLKHQLKERLYRTAFFIDAKQAKFNSRKPLSPTCPPLSA